MERRPATVGAEGQWQQVEGGGVHSSALLVVQIGRRWQGGCVLKEAVRRWVSAASLEEGGDSVEFQRGQAARGQGGVLGQSDDRGPMDSPATCVDSRQGDSELECVCVREIA